MHALIETKLLGTKPRKAAFEGRTVIFIDLKCCLSQIYLGMQRWRDRRSRTHGALSTFHDSITLFNWSLASSTTLDDPRSCTRHCNKGCQTIILPSALNISYYFFVLSLGLYLNYTHVSYFTVVSPITCVMRSRRIQRRTIRIIFPFLSTAVRWEKQGFQHFMIGERNCHMIF